MYCRDCHYNLQGLKAGSCPECGRGFDPADASTYWDGRLPIARWFWTWLLVFAGLTFLGGVLISLANEVFYHGDISELGWPHVIWSTGHLPRGNSNSYWHFDGIFWNGVYSVAFGAGAAGLLVLVRKHIVRAWRADG